MSDKQPFFLPNARDIEYFVWAAATWMFFFVAGTCTGAGIFSSVDESYGLHIFAASASLLVTSLRWGLYAVSKRSFLLKPQKETTPPATAAVSAEPAEVASGEIVSSHWMYDWVQSTLFYRYVNVESLIRKSIQAQYFFGKIHPLLITIWDDILLLILAITLSFEYEKSTYWSSYYGPAALSGASMYIFSNFVTSIATGFFLYTPIEENAYLSFWGLRKAFCHFWVILSTETWTRRDLPSPDKHAAISFMDIPSARLLDGFRKAKYIASWLCSLTAFGLYMNRVNDWAWVAGVGLSLAAIGLWLHAHVLAWITYFKAYNIFTVEDDYVNIYPLHKIPEKKETWTLKNSFAKIAHLWNPDPILIFFLFLFIVIPYGVPLLVEQPVPEHWVRYLYVSTVAVLAYWFTSFVAWTITYRKMRKVHDEVEKRFNPFRMYMPWFMIVWENDFIVWLLTSKHRRADLPMDKIKDHKGFKLVENWRIGNYIASWIFTAAFIVLFNFVGKVQELLAPALSFVACALAFWLYSLQADHWVHKYIAADAKDDKDVVFPYKKSADGKKIFFDEGNFTWFYSVPEVLVTGVVLAYNIYVGTPFNVSQWVAWSIAMAAVGHQFAKTIIWLAVRLPDPFSRFWWILIYPFYTLWIPFVKRIYEATKDTEEEKARKRAEKVKREAEKLEAERVRLQKLQEELEKKYSTATTTTVVLTIANAQAGGAVEEKPSEPAAKEESSAESSATKEESVVVEV